MVVVEPEEIEAVATELAGGTEQRINPDGGRLQGFWQQVGHIPGRFGQFAIQAGLLLLQILGEHTQLLIGIVEPQPGAHPGQQLLGIGGLAEEIVGTCVKTPHPVLNLGA